MCSRGVTPRTRHREVQGSNPVRFFLFILCFFSFSFFSFAFLVWKFDVLLVVCFPYGHSKQTRSLLLLDLYMACNL